MRPCFVLLVTSLLVGCSKSSPSTTGGGAAGGSSVDTSRPGASAAVPVVAAPPGRASGKVEDLDVEVVQGEGVVRPDGMIELQLIGSTPSSRKPCTELSLPSVFPGDTDRTPATLLALRLPWKPGVADPAQVSLNANYPRKTGETWSRSSGRWTPTGAVEVLTAPTEVGSAGRLKLDVKLAPDEARHLRGGTLKGEVPVYVCAQPTSLKMR